MENTKRLRRLERRKELSDNEATAKIAEWLAYFELSKWLVLTEWIKPDQIDYNGETYFIAIERDFKKKYATIFHDVYLTEESIVHELLHIVYPKEQEGETYEEYEKWIDLVSYEYCENVEL